MNKRKWTFLGIDFSVFLFIVIGFGLLLGLCLVLVGGLTFHKQIYCKYKIYKIDKEIENLGEYKRQHYGFLSAFDKRYGYDTIGETIQEIEELKEQREELLVGGNEKKERYRIVGSFSDTAWRDGLEHSKYVVYTCIIDNECNKYNTRVNVNKPNFFNPDYKVWERVYYAERNSGEDLYKISDKQYAIAKRELLKLKGVIK